MHRRTAVISSRDICCRQRCAADFHLNVGEAARLIAIDGDAGVTVIVIEVFDPADFDSLLDAVQPVLDSRTFG